eukprot:scaffold31347_cov40-Phaeocystis_antarctica.AAC.1
MFDGPVRTSEWVWAGRFAWVGQQGCQATRRAPQTVASISAAASSVDGEKYLRETQQRSAAKRPNEVRICNTKSVITSDNWAAITGYHR